MKPVLPIDVAKLIKPFASYGVTQKDGQAHCIPCNHPISANTTQNVIDHLQISMIHLCATVCMSQSAIWHRSMMSDKRKGRKCKPRGFPFSAVFPCFPPFFLLFGDLNFFGMVTMQPCSSSPTSLAPKPSKSKSKHKTQKHEENQNQNLHGSCAFSGN
uniref:Uncharacterized protein n=1 Tax=Eutreptiella gymnastica TaxID=73025 RepID=A0A7S1I1N2_9EUGL